MENKEKIITIKEQEEATGVSGLALDEVDTSRLATRLTNLKLTSEIIKKSMTEGVDYMTIAGTEKPMLMKVGAQKLLITFGLIVQYKLEDKTEERGDDENEPYFEYVYSANIYKNNLLIATNTAECNSRELSWGKDKDPFNIKNNIRQKAQKRAMVQAVTNIANIGELFSASIEEIKNKNQTETVGQKQLMAWYGMIPTTKVSEKEKKIEKAKRRRELCDAWSIKMSEVNRKYVDFPEVLKSDLDAFRTHIKDYRTKWTEPTIKTGNKNSAKTQKEN
jgi:hypothetical protein